MQKFFFTLLMFFIGSWVFVGAKESSYDTVRFVWKGTPLEYATSKTFHLLTSNGETFVVEWGDGTQDTVTCENDIFQYPEHEYVAENQEYAVLIRAIAESGRVMQLYIEEAEVSSLDVSGAPHLAYLSAFENQISFLDVSGNTYIENLSLSDNTLTSLRLGVNDSLSYFNCANNGLAIDSLYAIYKKLPKKCDFLFGEQKMPTKKAQIGKAYSMPIHKIEGEAVSMEVLSSGIPAVLGEEYTYIQDSIRFLKNGYYTVCYTHPVFDASDGAKVIYPFELGEDNVQEIEFSWYAPAGNINISISGNKGKWYGIDWGDGQTEQESVFTGGTESIRHRYATAGEYTVKMKGILPDAYFSSFEFSGTPSPKKQITKIDVSKVKTLEKLIIKGNALKSLDVCKNPILVTLDCGFNRIDSLDVSKNLEMVTLFCSDNLLKYFRLREGKPVPQINCERNYLNLEQMYMVSQGAIKPSVGAQFFGDYLEVEAESLYYLSPIQIGEDSTKIDIKKYGSVADSGKDYHLEKDSIFFLLPGYYTVSISNAAIKSETKAQLSGSFLVGNMEKEELLFTWLGEGAKSVKIQCTPYEESYRFSVDWGDGKMDTIKVTGRLITLNHSYTGSEVRQVCIKSLEKIPFFQMLLADGVSLSELHTHGAPGLKGISVKNNQLQKIDIGQNKALSILYCDQNALGVDQVLLLTEQMKGTNLSFGEQNPLENTVKLKINVPIPVKIGENYTVFEVKNSAGPAIYGEDYWVDTVHEAIRFLKGGKDTVEITNASFPSGTRIKVPYHVLSKDLRLLGLSLSQGILNPSFESSTLSYWTQLPYNIDTITIAAKAHDATATVKGIGLKSLKIGENLFNVWVIASDGGDSVAYQVKALRNAADSNTCLSSLSLSKGTLAPFFHKDSLTYNAEVVYAVDSVEVSAISESGKAQIEGTGKKALQVGKNRISIEVTAEDTVKKRTYIIEIERKAQEVILDSNTCLSSLSLSKGTLAPTFHKDSLEYSAEVAYEISSVQINALAESKKAQVKGQGEKVLIVGNNAIVITVTAEDGKVRVYTVYIHRLNQVSNEVEKGEGQIKIWPNPVSTCLYISCKGSFDYEVWDVRGLRWMKGKNSQTILTEGLPKGIYFLRIRSANSLQTLRFVK